MAIAKGVRSPDQIYMEVQGLTYADAQTVAQEAAVICRRLAPKLTGESSKRIVPIWGEGWFGVHWVNARVWFQNTGVHPFVMRSLAGKVIPMWIDDPTGKERENNPKAKTRVTESGKTQVLIFRRAAQMGQRKLVNRKVGGTMATFSVPMSYPGAPGRINIRESGAPYTTKGKVGGQIAKGNVGLRWYFPGLSPRNFLQQGLIEAAATFGLAPSNIKTGYDFYSSRNEES